MASYHTSLAAFAFHIVSEFCVNVSKSSLFLLTAVWHFIPHLFFPPSKDIYVAHFSLLHWSAKSSIPVQISLYMCEYSYMVDLLYHSNIYIINFARYHQIAFIPPALYESAYFTIPHTFLIWSD